MDWKRAAALLQVLSIAIGTKPGGTPPRQRQTRKHPHRTRLVRWIKRMPDDFVVVPHLHSSRTAR